MLLYAIINHTVIVIHPFDTLGYYYIFLILSEPTQTGRQIDVQSIVFTWPAAFLINCLAAGVQIAGTVIIHCIFLPGFEKFFLSPSIAYSLIRFNECTNTSISGTLVPFIALISFASCKWYVHHYITSVDRIQTTIESQVYQGYKHTSL